MRIRTFVVAAGSAAALAGIAIPAVAQTSTDYPTSTTPTGTTPGKGHGRHHGGRGFLFGGLTDAQLSTVAKKLGVTVDKLKAAQATVKKTLEASTTPRTRPDLAALLAKELGVTSAQVREAFALVAPARGDRGPRGFDGPRGDRDGDGPGRGGPGPGGHGGRGHGGRGGRGGRGGDCDRGGAGPGAYPTTPGATTPDAAHPTATPTGPSV